MVPQWFPMVLGAPVWSWTLPPIVAAYIQKNTITNKNIALFCTHNGNPMEALSDFEKYFSSKNKIIEVLSLHLILRDAPEDNAKMHIQELDLFCNGILEKI